MAEIKQFMLESDDDDPAPSVAQEQTERATAAMMLALSALSKKTIIAISHLFTLLLAGSAFALWWRVLPEPTTLQLIGLSLYAAFVLAIHIVRSK